MFEVGMSEKFLQSLKTIYLNVSIGIYNNSQHIKLTTTCGPYSNFCPPNAVGFSYKLELKKK